MSEGADSGTTPRAETPRAKESDDAPPLPLGLNRRSVLAGASTGVFAMFIDSWIARPTPAFAAAPSWVTPLQRPIEYRRGFNFYSELYYRDRHYALDMGSETSLAVYAMASGSIYRNEWDDQMGWIVVISHGSSYYTLYAHLTSQSTLAKNTTVAAGQRLGTMGETGSAATGAHLHLELFKGGYARHDPYPSGYRIDPEPIVRAAPDYNQAPTEVEEEMPSVGSKLYAPAQAIPTSDYKNIVMNDVGDVSLFVGGAVMAVASFAITGLPVGQTMRFRFIKYRDDGSIGSTGAVEVVGTLDTTYAQIAGAVDLGDDGRLRLQAKAETAGVVVSDVAVRGLRWAP
jgi:murein DD-endopeptidase MepM/ murein hydrolase activator NlpD